MALSSCSDNDDGPKEGSGVTVDFNAVFPEGVYKTPGIKDISYNSEGLVSNITTDYGETITYEYVSVGARAEDPYVLMTCIQTDDDYWYKSECKMTLNANGFVEYCRETITSSEDENEVEEWWFGYNSDNQINYMKRTEGGNEVTNITYTNGDITEVKLSSDVNNNYAPITFEYTTDDQPTPIENLGGIMLFDDCFEIDMDEMRFAYMAGLLGKATKHLPLRRTEVYTYEYVAYMNWTLNSFKLPIKLDIVQNGQTYEDITIIW